MISGRKFVIAIATPIIFIVIAMTISFALLISRERADKIASIAFEEAVTYKNWKASDFIGPVFSTDSSELSFDYCWSHYVDEHKICIVVNRRPLEVKAYIYSNGSIVAERIPLK